MPNEHSSLIAYEKDCEDAESQDDEYAQRWFVWDTMGPGLLVCLADADVATMLISAQSGALFKYSLIPVVILIVPILVLTLEAVARLGIHTGWGFSALVRREFGPKVAWFYGVFLVAGAIGTIISSVSGFAFAASLWGVDQWIGAIIAFAIINSIVFTCSYNQIMAIGTCFGLLNVGWCVAMFAYHPSPTEVLKGMWQVNGSWSQYMSMTAANLGASLMPWMFNFNQSAMAARRVRLKNRVLCEERAQLVVGGCFTHFLMISAMVAVAASPNPNMALKTAHDLRINLEPALGKTATQIILTLSFAGSSLCAAIVCALTAAWCVAETAGRDERDSLDVGPMRAPVFYASFVVETGIGVGVLITGVDIFVLNTIIEISQALILPFCFLLLFLMLTGDVLPDRVRVKYFHKYLMAVLFSITGLVVYVTAAGGLWGHGHPDIVEI